MKNIFIFNECVRGSVYGIGTYIQQLIKCLQNQSNISLNVIELYAEVDEFYVKEKDKYKIFYVPNVKNVKRDLYCRNVLYLIQPIISTLNSNNMVFILNYYYKVDFVILMRTFYPHSKIVITIHFQHWCFLLNGNVSYFRKILNQNNSPMLTKKEEEVLNSYKLERELYRNVDLVICLSKFTYKLLQTDYYIPRNRIALIYNGVEDCKEILSSQDKIKFKSLYFIPNNEKIILFVGRLDEVKGVSFLIETFKALLTYGMNYTLLIIGGGNYERYIQEAQSCCGKVLFLGHLEREQLYKFYQIADIGVQLSLHEQCSFVTIEMMMFNIPLLVSNTTGLNEMIRNESCKVYVNFNEDNRCTFPIQECRDKIYEILNRESAMEFKTRSIYEEKYTLDKMYMSLLSLDVFI